MKITIKNLRQIIREAIVDHMRFPRGPNSRDDAGDRPLTSKMPDKFNLEEDLILHDVKA
jgi:hypothetical protein